MDDLKKELGREFTQEELFYYSTIYKPKENNDFHDYHPIEAVQNKFDEESQGLIQTQQASLQNSIINLEARVVQSVINSLFKVKNDFKDDDIITKDEEENFKKELAIILAGYYGIMIPLFGKSTTDRRAKEFNLFTNFTLNDEIKKYINDIAEKASSSHIQTTLKDVLDVINETYNKNVQSQLEAINKTRKVTDSDLILARKKALEGASQRDIINAIKNEFNDTISKVRAKAIARTETNRAFTQSQFQADLQFIKQNHLEGRAYKKWITRSDNPCAICINLASQPPIPFKTNFADIGDELTGIFTNAKGVTRVIKQVVSFEDLAAGNAHVNCACVYQLIIEGFSENSFDKEQNYNKNHDPASGKFSSGGGSFKDYSKYSVSEAHSELSRDFKSQTTFSSEETDEISDYADSSFQYTNTELREKKGVVSKLGSYRKETVKTIDGAMRNKLNENTVLYRGAYINQKLSKGDTIKDFAYTSTSFRDEIGSEFIAQAAIHNQDNLYLFKIKGKKNQKGIVVSMAHPSEVQRYESEFLLPRNTKFKIDKITEKKDSGIVYNEVEAEIL